MQRPWPSSDFTRGWELIAHFLLMLRASLLRHIIASLALAVIAGFLWFQAGVRDREASLARYAYFAATNDPACAVEQRRFDGRTVPFLAKQWGIRVAAVGLLAFCLGSLIVARQGRMIRQRKLLRGVELTGKPSSPFQTRRAELVAAVATLAAVVAFQLLSFDDRIGALPNYIKAWATSNSLMLARFLSPDGTGAVVWFDGPWIYGFYESKDVVAILGQAFRRSVPALAALFLARLAAATVLAILLVRWLRKANLLRTIPPRDAWVVAGVPVPDEKACYHFLFCGSPGSGKSTAIKETLDQIRARGRRAIVYDLSGEYIEHFYREGTDLILNPLDARSEAWTPWAEIRSDSDYTMLARSLFPPGGQEPFWSDASATLFAATMMALEASGQTTNHDLYTKLTHGALEELHEFLRGTPAARLLDPKAGAMPSNLIATVTSKLAAWTSLPDARTGQSPFSIRDFVRRPDGDAWLFLSTTEDQRALLKPLLSLWSDVAATAILTLEKCHESKIWFVLDEVASLQKLPALPGLLERGRKHGCATLLGLQAMPQLEDAYGNKLARAIASQPQTWLVLRSVEPETARFLESALGQTEFVEAQTSYSMGAQSYRDGVSLQERVATRPVALASEISSLPDLSGFLKLPGGHEVFRVSYRYRERAVIAPPFVPRSPC